MLNAAFIGNGKSTNRYHLPFLLKTNKFRVKTIYARTIKDDWAKLAGVHYTTNIDDVWQDDDLDLVIITTPNQWHYHYAKLALEHGHNVLLEKPFTEKPEEARELFQLAKEKGLMIQGYQNRRFDSDFLTVQKVIESGRLGQLLEVEMHYDYYRPEVPEAVHQYSRTSSYLFNHACHTVDQVLSYWGQPERIHYDVRQLLGKNRMNDYFDIDLYYEHPLKISVKSSYFRLKERPSFVLYGTKGVFVKEKKDRQEYDLKHFYLPDHEDFGLDRPEDYGLLTYLDEKNTYHEEKVISEIGDYSLFYQALYETLAEGRQKLVRDEETISLIDILDQGVQEIERADSL
ncbi:Gfo/Idh/MocA family oxidoreductase [Streptococcus caviae]|uniref:Gfo/Idh/MocA family oxidoreductase n=1 Tax=Streptococcus sp. 'caviae' TaxID=1915004 RepID=UPI00094BA944|nr:Gfo/Idh/MocA family oxidoreductase [Streptococcus sp. 'caviae']OLN82658.1 NAD(P)-dependent oxidoreductase [Streptococcus sp. 'caviae']